MDSEQTNDKPAEQKTAAKRPARKPATRKKTQAASEPVAETAAPAADAPAPQPVADKKKPARKPRTPKAPKQQEAAPAREHTPAAAPATAPAPVQEPPKQEQHTTPPQPIHVMHQDREERAAEHVNVPREQPRDNEPAPAPGFAVPETVGGNEGGGGNGRRKRRGNNENQPQQGQPQHPQVDADELVRRAWKIYLGEVTEEGLALMDERTAAEASRRAFRVAEIFLQEAARHRRTQVQAPAPQAGDDTPETEEE